MKGSILCMHCGLLLLLMYVVVPNMAVVVSVRCCAQPARVRHQQGTNNCSNVENDRKTAGGMDGVGVMMLFGKSVSSERSPHLFFVSSQDVESDISAQYKHTRHECMSQIHMAFQI